MKITEKRPLRLLIRGSQVQVLKGELNNQTLMIVLSISGFFDLPYNLPYKSQNPGFNRNLIIKEVKQLSGKDSVEFDS
jgi:hypothetical protein